jgi:hypothetical protein
LPSDVDPDGLCVIDEESGWGVFDADGYETGDLSLTIETKEAHIDENRKSHGATVSELADKTNGRYILACKQAEGEKTVKLTVTRPAKYTAFGAEWVKLFQKDSWAEVTSEYEPHTFNTFGAKVPLLRTFNNDDEEKGPTATEEGSLTVYMEVSDIGDYEVMYGNPNLTTPVYDKATDTTSDGWVAVQFKKTLLRVGSPWAECSGDELPEKNTYDIGTIVPAFFGHPNLNKNRYAALAAELSDATVPVKVVLEIFDKERKLYTMSEQAEDPKTVLVKEPMRLVRGQKVGTVVASTSYEVSFRFRLHSSNGSWKSIVSFSVNGMNYPRRPAIFLHPDTSADGGKRIHNRHATKTNKNDGVDSPEFALNLEQDHHYRTRVTSAGCELFIDGERIGFQPSGYDAGNLVPGGDVLDVYVSHPDYIAADLTIWELTYEALREDEEDFKTTHPKGDYATCYEAGNACPEAHGVCKAKFCEMDTWEEIIRLFQAGGVEVLGSVGAGTTSAEYAVLDDKVDGFFFMAEGEIEDVENSVFALGEPLLKTEDIDAVDTYVTLSDSNIGVWNPYSWYPHIDNSKWAAIVDKLASADVATTVDTLFDRGYGYVFLTDQAGFKTSSTYNTDLLAAIAAKEAAGRRLQDRQLSTPKYSWGCDDTRLHCSPVCLAQDGPVTTIAQNAKCADAPVDPCQCKCYYDAAWTCIDGEVGSEKNRTNATRTKMSKKVVCQATKGIETMIVGDLLCENRGTPKPTFEEMSNQHQVGECQRLPTTRGQFPIQQCLTQWRQAEEVEESSVAPANDVEDLYLDVTDSFAAAAFMIVALSQ